MLLKLLRSLKTLFFNVTILEKPFFKKKTTTDLGFPGGSVGKEPACQAGDPGSIPGWERSPGEGHGNTLQYSGLENSMDSRAWRGTVPGVTNSWTRLSDYHFLLFTIATWWVKMNAIESVRYNNGNFFKKGKKQISEGKMTVETQLLLWKRVVGRIPLLSFWGFKGKSYPTIVTSPLPHF